MLQNLLYQETWRESFSNSGCTHSPAVLEVVQGRGLPGRWLSHPVRSSVFKMQGCKAFHKLLSPPLQPHLLPQTLLPRKVKGIPSSQMHSAKFLPLSLCPCGFVCLVVLSPPILLYSLASGLISDVQSSPELSVTGWWPPFICTITALSFLLTHVLHQCISIYLYLYHLYTSLPLHMWGQGQSI